MTADESPPLPAPEPAPTSTPVLGPEQRPLRPVAPVWHTVLLLAYIAGISYLSANSAADPVGIDEGAMAPHPLSRPAIYGTVLISEWLLFAVTYWGFRLGGLSMSDVIGPRWRGWSGVFRCLLIAAGAWVVTFVGVAQALDALGFRNPEQVKELAELILPRGAVEIALWLVVSLTAGFVEEFVFRGYLQRQFGAWCRNAYLGIVLAAVVFGAGHLYQGMGAAVLILIVGFCLAILAYATKSLLPGMVAHAAEDFISGLIGRA